MSEETEKTPETEENTSETPETDVPETEETAAETEEEKKKEDEKKVEGLEAEVNVTGPCKVAVKVAVPKAAIDAECAKNFDELTPNAQIPGFRKGHAPRKLVERHYQGTVIEEVKQQMIARSWDQVRKEHKLRAIGEFDLPDENIDYDEEKGLSYHFDLEVSPSFEPGEYKGLELTKPSAEVDESAVDEMLASLAKRNAVLEPVEDGKTRGDDVPVVDVDIKVDGEVIHTVSDQEIVLGVDNWLRGLDENFWKDLCGKAAGEAATKKITLPDTYQKEEHRGKEADLTVTIKDIKRPRLPEINDEFAKDLLYEDLESLKKEIRERLAGSKEREVQQALARQVEEKLLEQVSFDLPEELKSRMTERAVNRQKLQLAYQGASRDDIEQAADQISEGVAARTERDMRMFFILQRIAEDEDITVSDAELERRVQLMAQMEGQRAPRFREDLRREGQLEMIRNDMRDEKTMEFLVREAKVAGESGAETKKSKGEKSAKKDEAAEGEAPEGEKA